MKPKNVTMLWSSLNCTPISVLKLILFLNSHYQDQRIFSIDSPAVAQLKSSLRESKRQLEKCQEKLTLAETKVRQLDNHADDLQR